MSQAVITKAFSEWKAQQAINNQPVTLDEFIFAYIPGLDTDKPISNTEAIPAADKIVHRQAVSKSGVVNAQSVVYSITLGADVGDFNFNWIGLVNKATSTLAMIIHAPTQSKIKNASGQQGNVLVRSMLMEYSGAQDATQITTPAETWQIDFTARLAAMDERQRLENIDLYGAAAFFDAGYLVAKTGAQFYVTKGTGYVAGLRAELAANQNITVSAKPVKVWLDVSWSGTLTSVWAVQSKITVAANLANYAESGVQHFVFALASIDASGNITDLRPKGTLNAQAFYDALVTHEKSRNHPDASKTEKGFVQLSSETNSDAEDRAATPKAVNAAKKEVTDRLGTAASKNINTSHTERTGGNVLSYGDFGIGSAIDVAATTDLNDLKVPGRYKQKNTNVSWNSLHYPASLAGGLVVIESAGYSDGCTQLYFPWRGNKIYYRNYSGTGSGYQWDEWGFFYSSTNKPTPEDLNALPVTGGSMSGVIVVDPAAGSGMWSQQNDDNRLAPVFQKIESTATSYYFPLVKQRYAVGKSTWSMGTLINDNKWCLHFISDDDTAGKVFSWQKDGQFIPPSYANFDERYQAKGSYYTTTQSDARFQAKGSYYTTTQADARYQLKNSASKAINGWFKDASTGMIYQWGTTAAIVDDTLSTVTFPIAFPSACVAFLPTLKRSTVTANKVAMLSVWGQAMSNTSANIVFQSNDSNTDARSGVITYWAVGY